MTLIRPCGLLVPSCHPCHLTGHAARVQLVAVGAGPRLRSVGRPAGSQEDRPVGHLEHHRPATVLAVDEQRDRIGHRGSAILHPSEQRAAERLGSKEASKDGGGRVSKESRRCPKSPIDEPPRSRHESFAGSRVRLTNGVEGFVSRRWTRIRSSVPMPAVGPSPTKCCPQ